MRAILAALLAAVVGSPAHAGPRPLSDAELGRIAAGLLDTYIVMPVILVNNQNTSTAAAVGSRSTASTAVSNITVNDIIRLAPSDVVGRLSAVTIAAPTLGGVAGPTIIAPATGGTTAAQPPVWVPWAAELRPSLGAR
jgi:hypothetical protein